MNSIMIPAILRPRGFRILRIFSRHWKLTAVAVFSLSIAMALGVVSLSVSNTFLFLPPAAAWPERLVTLYTRTDTSAIEQVSYPDYQYYRENNHVFTDIAAAPNSISMYAEQSSGKGEIKVFSRPVSGNYLSLMGIRPFLGRLLSPDDEANSAAVAVMTWSCWQRLGADRKIVGKVVASYTIVGVTPKEFTGSLYGINGDLLTPLSRLDARRAQRGERHLFLTARLRPGVTRQQAQAEMSALSGRLAAAWPTENRRRSAVVVRASLLPPDALATAEMLSAVLTAVVLFVLLIACANVANLLLAVAVGRRQEAAVKLALGARRGRLILEFLQESTVLCLASAALGYALAAALILRFSVLTFAFPTYGTFSFALNLRLDATVAALAAVLVLIAILATGLPPALYASSPSVAQVLSGEAVVGGTRKSARRNALVVVQVALCTVVLVGMGLCQQSLYNLRHVDPGFTARNLVAAQVFNSSTGNTPARGKALYETLRSQVSALPGVESVSFASDLPLFGGTSEPAQSSDSTRKSDVSHAVVDQSYFQTFGISILAGRVFNSLDIEGSPETVVINNSLAKQFWPGQDAVGKTLLTGNPARPATVVGVVRDGRYEGLDTPPSPFLYYALSRHYQDRINIIARTKGRPQLWVEPLSKVLRGLDLPVPWPPFTFDGWMNLTLLAERLTAGCAAALGALGLLLAVIGLFAAVSWSVSERKKEMGIRAALGARPSHLLRMVLWQTLRVAGTGVAIGLLLGVGATLLLRSQLYGIGALEWTVLLGAGAGMLAVSLLVAYLSARPGIRVHPMEAVRHA